MILVKLLNDIVERNDILYALILKGRKWPLIAELSDFHGKSRIKHIRKKFIVKDRIIDKKRWTVPKVVYKVFVKTNPTPEERKKGKKRKYNYTVFLDRPILLKESRPGIFHKSIDFVSKAWVDIIRGADMKVKREIIEEKKKRRFKIVRTRPIFISDRKKGRRQIGYIEYAFSKDIINRAIRRSIFSVVLSSAGIVVIGILLGFLISIIMIVSPIKKLADGADIFAAGKLGHRIRLKSKDEFGKLAKIFNKMASKLSGTLTELKEKYAEVKRLFKLATEDGLTKAFVHRYLLDILENELKRAKRYNKPISFLMSDIDHFKSFNDTYGHQIGDLVLQKVSETLLKNVRGVLDTVGRYGGEEFGIILPETGKEGAIEVAEKLRKLVESAEISYKQGQKLKVTVSLGVATLKDDYVNKEKFVSFADKALYKSKESGRNRVTFYDGH